MVGYKSKSKLKSKSKNKKSKSCLKGGTLKSAIGSFIYQNLGKNKSHRGTTSFQILKSIYKNISEDSSKDSKFLKIIYNRGQPNEFEIGNYAGKAISSYSVTKEPYIWLRNFERHLLVMIDISSINPTTGKPHPILNWAATVRYYNKSGTSIINYLPPYPASGIHRFKFILYKYPDNLQYKVSDSSPPDRHIALKDIHNFVKTNGLKPVTIRVMSVIKRDLGTKMGFFDKLISK